MENLMKSKRNSTFNYILDGMIMDDLKDFRPGLKARDEFEYVVYFKKHISINQKLEN